MGAKPVLLLHKGKISITKVIFILTINCIVISNNKCNHKKVLNTFVIKFLHIAFFQSLALKLSPEGDLLIIYGTS